MTFSEELFSWRPSSTVTPDQFPEFPELTFYGPEFFNQMKNLSRNPAPLPEKSSASSASFSSSPSSDSS